MPCHGYYYYRGSLLKPRNRFNRDKQFRCADIKLACNFTDNGGDYLVNITVAGIHAKSNVKHTIKNGEYTSGLADHGADNKHYLHYNRAIGFAFDSMGYISKSATVSSFKCFFLLQIS